MKKRKNPSDNFDNRKMAVDFIEKASGLIYNSTTSYTLENYIGIEDLNKIVEKLNEILIIMKLPGPRLPQYTRGSFFR